MKKDRSLNSTSISALFKHDSYKNHLYQQASNTARGRMKSFRTNWAGPPSKFTSVSPVALKEQVRLDLGVWIKPGCPSWLSFVVIAATTSYQWTFSPEQPSFHVCTCHSCSDQPQPSICHSTWSCLSWLLSLCESFSPWPLASPGYIHDKAM